MTGTAAPQVLNFYAVGKRIPEGAVYIGRSGSSRIGQWGNPFSIDDGNTRESVVEQYRRHLLADAELMARARQELVGKDLVCFCAPRACHGDVLRDVANS